MAKILIVEDDADARSLLREVVVAGGHEPIERVSAEDAHDILRDNSFELALLDIFLPGELGVSLAWRLRNLYPDLPIVIVSAVLEHWSNEDLTDCGADAVVEKPFGADQLLNVIHTLLRDGRKSDRLARCD